MLVLSASFLPFALQAFGPKLELLFPADGSHFATASDVLQLLPDGEGCDYCTGVASLATPLKAQSAGLPCTPSRIESSPRSHHETQTLGS